MEKEYRVSRKSSTQGIYFESNKDKENTYAIGKKLWIDKYGNADDITVQQWKPRGDFINIDKQVMIIKQDAVNKKTFEEYIKNKYSGWKIVNIKTLKPSNGKYRFGTYEVLLISK